MNCEQFSRLLTEYLQGELSNQQIKDIEHHLAHCDDCKLLLQIRRDCRQLDKDSQMPADFSSSWRKAILKQGYDGMVDSPPKNRFHMNQFSLTRWLALAASLFFVFGGTWMIGRTLNEKSSSRQPIAQFDSEGSGDLSHSNAALPAPKMDLGTRASSESFMTTEGAAASGQITKPQKIITTLSIDLVTRSFDEDLIKLNEALINTGGSVEYSNITGERGNRRYARMTLRIPQNQLDHYVKEVKEFHRVTSITESKQDVSEQYFATNTRLQTQTIKLGRLQELLTRANLVADILDIEREIADTQYEVDRLTGSLSSIDSKVELSTINLTLQEEVSVTQAGELKLGERIKTAVTDAWQVTGEFLKNLVVLLVVTLPYLLALIILILIGKIIFRRKKK